MTLGALVLAAGRGTRLAPLRGALPKPLVDFAGRTLLEWNLAWLAAHGVREAWVNLHYLADTIVEAVGDEACGVRVRYSYEPELLGTAGAWRKLQEEWRGTSLVVYGDNVTRFDLDAMLMAHRETGTDATIALFDPATHANTGIAGGWARREADGRVTAFVEGKRPAGEGWYVNAGVYMLEPAVRRRIEDGPRDFGREVLPRMAELGHVHGHVIEPGGFCLGVDTPERYKVAEELVAAGTVTL